MKKHRMTHILATSMFSALLLTALSAQSVQAQVEGVSTESDTEQTSAPLATATHDQADQEADSAAPIDTQSSWQATQPNQIEIEEQSDQDLLSNPTFQEEGARFSLAILPDTQFYSRYATEGTGNQFDAIYGSEPFNAQTQWIADYDNKYNIEMTLHVGDVVDQSGVEEEWQVADEAMSILERAHHSYAIVAGNHDIGGETYYDHYLNTFSSDRAQADPSLVAIDETGAHRYHQFQVGDQNFAVLALSWGADQQAVEWANGVLNQNQHIPTILVSHQLINIDPDTEQALPTDFGEYLWQNLISPNNQIYLTLNGHHHGATYTERTNAQGNPVYQVLMDYQMAYMGGNGYMGLLEHDLSHNQIHLTTFSPWVVQKDADTLVAEDQAILQATSQSFTIDFDFANRFAGFNITDDLKPSYTYEIRSSLIENFDEPEAVVYQEPRDEYDYPQVEGTVAHWRIPTHYIGQVVPVGGAIFDESTPANSFFRAPLNQEGIGGAELDHVTISGDAHPLSSNKASIRFTGGSRNVTTGLPYKTASYFRTQADAPINSETFDNGYTFESFVKFDPDYVVEDNRWMQWLVREGQRQNLENYQGTEGEEPPFAWALSNLKEVQFAYTDSQDIPQEGSNWSGEIVNLDDWYHIAVVNDPVEKTVIMYVNGVPVLRNTIGAVGIGNDNNQPWSLGAGQYAGEREAGFIGWVGEIRLVNRPLDQSEWLISRDDRRKAQEPVAPTPIKTETETPGQDIDPTAELQAKVDELDRIIQSLSQTQLASDHAISELKKTVEDLQADLSQAELTMSQLEAKVVHLEEKVKDLCHEVILTPAAQPTAELVAVQTSEDSAQSKVADSQSSKEAKKTGNQSSSESSDFSSDSDELPQTGVSSGVFLAATSILAGLGLAQPRKRK